MKAVLLYLVPLFYLQWSPCTEARQLDLVEKCTQKFMDLSLVKYRAQHLGRDEIGDVMENNLRVLTEYQFNCSLTNITSLQLGIKIREMTLSRKNFPTVMIFRWTNKGYNLVSSSKRWIYYSTSNVSTTGVYEYPLNPPIPVMRGDLLAVSQPMRGVVVKFIVIEKVRFFSQEMSSGIQTIESLNGNITNEAVLVYPITDGYCVNSLNSITASVIIDIALKTAESKLLSKGRQYIYPEMILSCNGSVTKWIYGGTSMLERFELQIWRQIGPNNYIRIGFSSATNSEMIGINLYQFIPQPPLHFEEGDIFGIYIPNSNYLTSLYAQNRNGPISIIIQSNNPLVKVNELDSLVETEIGFPLITAEISISNAAHNTFISSITSITPISVKVSPTTVIPVSVKVSSTTVITVYSSTSMSCTHSMGLSSSFSTSALVSSTNSAMNEMMIPISIAVGAGIAAVLMSASGMVLISLFIIIRMKKRNAIERNLHNVVDLEPVYDIIVDLPNEVTTAPLHLEMSSNVAYGVSTSEAITISDDYDDDDGYI